MVMKEIKAMGIKDVTIAASSLGTAHDAIADMIEEGIVTGIQTSGIRGRLGEVVSAGKLKTPARNTFPRRQGKGNRGRRRAYRHCLHRRADCGRIRQCPAPLAARATAACCPMQWRM